MSRHLAVAALVAASFAAGNLSSVRTAVASPSAASSSADRVFEIRTYTTFDGRLDALNARFRDHTMRIFAKHGMTSVGYWIPQDSARSRNTLVYIISHASREQATRNWTDFVNDPEWTRVAAASEADGKIVSRIVSDFVTPTDYSPIK